MDGVVVSDLDPIILHQNRHGILLIYFYRRPRHDIGRYLLSGDFLREVNQGVTRALQSINEWRDKAKASDGHGTQKKTLEELLNSPFRNQTYVVPNVCHSSLA